MSVATFPFRRAGSMPAVISLDPIAAINAANGSELKCIPARSTSSVNSITLHHEFDADLECLFMELRFSLSDNQWGRSEGVAGNHPGASETAQVMIRSIVVRLGPASGDWQ